MENGHSDNQPVNSEKKSLYRASTDRVVGGVCKGLASYFGIDAIYVMFGFVGLTMFGFFFVPIIYLILWLVLPEESKEELPIADRAKENWAEVQQKLGGMFEKVRAQIKTLGLNN